jgi:heme/copper-type cytochrome/quinol oxidase subunit 2
VKWNLKVKKLIFLFSLVVTTFIGLPVTISDGAPLQSTYTPEVEFLFLVVILISIFIASLVFGLLIYILYRFREGSKTTRKRIDKEMRLEVGWIIFAAVIVISLFLLSLPVTESYIVEPESYDEEILVIAYSYNFTFIRENGTRTVDLLHIEVNKIYKLNLTSIDVIHSFYAHELSIKLDMIPGRYNIVYLQVTRPGEYEILCAEYCGPYHFIMTAVIIAT